MTTSRLVIRVSLLAMAFLSAGPPIVHAGKGGGTGTSVSVSMDFFDQVVDEQDLNSFYNTSGSCPGSSTLIDLAAYAGDLSNGPTESYGFGTPWTLSSSLSSSRYVNGADCNSSTGVCLGAKLNHNNKTLSLDTRGTLGPRTNKVDFRFPCFDCSLPGLDVSSLFGTSIVMTPGLISVFLDIPFTSMEICKSKACFEAQPAFVKFWFDDPQGDPQLTWRVDWPYVRVLRMSENTWYILADGCDGSRVASLYRLHNNKKRVSTSLQGYYLIPFFLSAKTLP